MGKKSSVKSNAAFNVVYKVVIYLFPLIIAGYVGRVLYSEGVGRVSFVQNIVSYFIAIVALGIPTYGTREIAKCSTASERNQVFSSLFIINAISTVICATIYYAMILVFPYFRNDILLYLVGGIQILFNFINIDWLYQGLEEHKYIAVRSIIVRFCSVICVFLFVKSSADAWKYLLINVFVNAGNYVFNALRAPKIVKLQIKGNEYKKHLNSIFVLLATVIAIELYTKIDTTFIGVMLEKKDVGYYTYANKIVQIVIMFLAAVNAVTLPKLSAYFKDGKKEEFHKLMTNIHYFNLLLAIPSSVGIFILAKEIVVLLFGDSFVNAELLLKTLCPLIIVMSVGNLYGTQAIIAIGQEKKKLFATLLAALINIIGTPLLIKSIGVSGACVASVVSEITVLIIYAFILKKYDYPYVRIRRIASIIGSAFIMAVIVLITRSAISNSLLKVVIGVTSGVVVYCVGILLTDNEARIFIANYLKKLKRT